MEEVSMNNYNPYDPNQNQSYGDPQNTINGQGTESTYSQAGGQEQNTQPYHGQTQGDSTYHYSYHSPYQNVVNTTATPVTGSAPVPPSKKKEKNLRISVIHTRSLKSNIGQSQYCSSKL